MVRSGMAKKPLPTVDEIRAAFDYAPETGVLRWRPRTGSSREDRIFNVQFAGQPAGAPNGSGYVRVVFRGKHYVAHRLIWKWWRGEEPPELDHEDTDRSNNRIANLREATRSQNVANGKLRSDNASGFKGVYRKGTRWVASIRKNGQRTWLGSFPTAEAASAAFSEAAKAAHGAFHRPL